MQYTGLKDRNGKEIYESDIIKSKTNILYEVVFDLSVGGWSYHARSRVEWPKKVDRQHYPGYFIKYPQWEVVGNIYETPELLKEVSND